MKLLECEVTNFGSYKHFKTDFSEYGLSLVEGPTGSGKSTLLDMPAWILFGITSKNGAVDDIKNWTAKDEETIGRLSVLVSSSERITVTRIRSKGGKNDLYWTEEGQEEKQRGKDLVETQGHLDLRMGASADLYLLCSSYNEFSPAGQFFMAKAKDRKAVLEGLTDLSFPTSLSDAASGQLSVARTSLRGYESVLSRLKGRVDLLQTQLTQCRTHSKQWEENHQKQIQETKEKLGAWNEVQEVETVRQQNAWAEEIVSLTLNIKDGESVDNQNNPCPTCGQSAKHKENVFSSYIYTAKRRIEELKEQIKAASDNKANPHLAALGVLVLTKDPHRGTLIQVEMQLAQEEQKLNEAKDAYKACLKNEASLTQLVTVATSLRAKLLDNTVLAAQNLTNQYLSKYFDAELTVSFAITNKDNLDIEINKGGYSCNFKQLSKGQRQLLKLCFSVALMKIAQEKASVTFNCIFLDEPTDGCDEALKVKSFKMFQDLSTQYQSVVVIEHNSEIKEMFTNRHKVELVNDTSQVTYG